MEVFAEVLLLSRLSSASLHAFCLIATPQIILL